ncbi:MAG TPA: type I restriction endonuclease [Verrucomicrobiae bacterium]|nr:type I restriction endonuclease [Verrucomicrobiae bacterium]
MNELLADIKVKLQNGDYKNEEHIRLSLVARVLQNLGWDIWNPKEVNTEFFVDPKEDKTRVDIALFLRPVAPAVFIEIKDVGQIQGRLAHIERQLRDYNRNHTAMFTIITDGREWRFYYSQTGGEFSKKLFETFNFEEDNLNDIEESFATFLKKSEIENGNAKGKAENYLQKNQKQQTAEGCLPEARRKISEPPYPSLPDALMSLVREEGFPITQDEAEKFIKEASERKPTTARFQPLVESPVSERKTKNTQHRRKKKDGKIAFVDELLLSGKYTKPEIAAQLSTKFEVPEKTAKNTVSWSASTICERHPGKKSNHLLNPKVEKMAIRMPVRRQQ